MNANLRLALIAALCSAAAAPAAARTQSAMNSSADREATAADRALNAQYSATMRRLSAPTRLLLRNAQRSWITFRDGECRLEASGVTGGSAYPMVYAGCLTRLTEDRTRQRPERAQCGEGDLSCPR
jgi:uncharacterized protein YecT (DUF1311 family)